MSTILIENGTLVTVNEKGEIYPRGYIFIENDLISEIAEGEAPSKYKKADQIIDANFMAVMPGMVNAHT
ncbi:MAG: amidohydrolase, partial [Chloroflexi bacterium HGW-Chloroflexi-8]